MNLTPQDLGFPVKFTQFRPAQSEAFEYGLTSDRRFTGLGAPPGVGKSGLAYGLPQLMMQRAVILTADRGLQDQYVADEFPDMLDMRGRSNFDCWEGGTCEDGARMECKDKIGCPYLNKLTAFNQSPVGLSNYAWWIAINNKARRGCELPEVLICDEAHLIFDWLSRSLDFHLSDRELHAMGIKFGHQPPVTVQDWKDRLDEIKDLAIEAYEDARTRARSMKDERSRAAVRRAEGILDRVKQIGLVEDDNWVVWREEGRDDGRAFRFECVWPYKYRERVFMGVPRVVLMSATMRPKTLSLLGIGKQEYDFKEWGRQFPAVNGPVIHYEKGGKDAKCRVNAKMTPETKKMWLDRILDVVRWGSDRKGLIHSVSYARAKEIAEYLIAHGIPAYQIVVNGAADPNTQTARQAYDQFVRMGPGAVLISPSFSTGWDFKYKIAEWQIIAKIAFADTRGPVMTRRKDQDPTYPIYLAAQDLVQSCGRVVRSETDRGVTIIVDDSWKWFGYQAVEFLPRWFKVRTEERLPRPLELL